MTRGRIRWHGRRADGARRPLVRRVFRSLVVTATLGLGIAPAFAQTPPEPPEKVLPVMREQGLAKQ